MLSGMPPPVATLPQRPTWNAQARDILQDQLAFLAETLLARDAIGIDDDFLALADSSLLAARFLGMVEGITGERFELAAFAGGLTVRNLAEALVARLPRGPVLEVQSGEPGGVPLFFLHGDLCGAGYYVRELARHLGSRQPVFVLQQHGMHGEDLPASAEDMVADHLARLNRVWPRGPFHIGGHCNGALLAFEIAQRLIAIGREPASLLLIEPPVKSAEHVAEAADIPTLPPEYRQRPHLRGLWLLSQYQSILLRCHMRPYSGRMAVFWAERRRVHRPGTKTLLQELAPQARIYSLPGNHITALGRNVAQAAETIRSWLSLVALETDGADEDAKQRQAPAASDRF